ncbi:MAG: hypothetical protein KatS3mg109_0621 [Pirellulaceae bacterium]|nr:MAG: hypothetical protein KatS3mg109_0621 [Pirellulaceae bacterium]
MARWALNGNDMNLKTAFFGTGEVPYNSQERQKKLCNMAGYAEGSEKHVARLWFLGAVTLLAQVGNVSKARPCRVVGAGSQMGLPKKPGWLMLVGPQ